MKTNFMYDQLHSLFQFRHLVGKTLRECHFPFLSLGTLKGEHYLNVFDASQWCSPVPWHLFCRLFSNS